MHMAIDDDKDDDVSLTPILCTAAVLLMPFITHLYFMDNNSTRSQTILPINAL